MGEQASSEFLSLGSRGSDTPTQESDCNAADDWQKLVRLDEFAKMLPSLVLSMEMSRLEVWRVFD